MLYLLHLPLRDYFSFSSGVGEVSASNLASMDPRRSTASGRPGLSGQTAHELVEAESCTGNAPAPARGKKMKQKPQVITLLLTLEMKKTFLCACFYNPAPSLGQKEIVESFTHLKILHFRTAEGDVRQVTVSAREHTHARAHTHS